MPARSSVKLRRVSSITVSRRRRSRGRSAVLSTASAGAPASCTETRTCSATPASHTSVLVPLRRALSPSIAAVVSMCSRSQSPSRSNSATVPTAPSQTFGNNSLCCSSLPPAKSPWMKSCVLTNGVPARCRPIGSTMATTSASDRLLPPSCSGTATASQPRSEISFHSSRLNPESEAICRRTSPIETFSRQKLTATSCSIACSSLNVIFVLNAIVSVLRQAEHTLADDVGLNLAGAAADRGRKRVEIGALPFAALDRVGIADIAHRIGAL